MFGGGAGGPGGPGGASANPTGAPPGQEDEFAEAQREFEAEQAARAKKQKEEEEAKKKAQEEAKHPPGFSEAEKKKNEGNAHYKKKDFEKAIELYTEAIEICPEEIIYYSNLAAVYIEMKEFDKAIEECEKAIEKTQGCSYDFKKLAKVYARKASALCNKGELDASIEVYKQALLENNDYWIKDSMKKVQRLKEQQEAEAYLNPELAE